MRYFFVIAATGLIVIAFTGKTTANGCFSKEKCYVNTGRFEEGKDCAPSDSTNRTIERLAKTAEDETYGFSPEHPVKVGSGPDGGPANQRRYLELLRDAKGKPIKYKRIASCCPYPSENGLAGFAMVDKYEIEYTNGKGKKKKALVYLSFYDYEEPKILYGFKTVEE